MLSITIPINCLILCIFWVAGFIAITPAYNHFVQYAHPVGASSLPILTQVVFAVRLLSLVVPGGWLLGSVLFLRALQKLAPVRRAELTQMHSALSLLLGLLIFVVFFAAGVLPYLKIGVSID